VFCPPTATTSTLSHCHRGIVLIRSVRYVNGCRRQQITGSSGEANRFHGTRPDVASRTADQS
ncbi:hypothetical protein U1Q18_025437, partial [Sarracenia purpurea var. burkii]